MQLVINADWQSTHIIETDNFDLPDDFDPDEIDWDSLDNWPTPILDQINSIAAELTDWVVEVD